LKALLNRFQNQRQLGAKDEQSTLSSDSSLSSNDSQQQEHRQNADIIRTTRVIRRIHRVVGQLFSILSLVRRPTSLSKNEKIYNYDFVSKLKDEYQELLGDLENHIEFYLRKNFKSASPEEQCTVPQYLITRFKQAAVFRRKALLLKSRHKLKLQGNVAAKFDQTPGQNANLAQPDMARMDVKAPAPTEAGSKILSETVLSIAFEPIKSRQAELSSQPAPKSSKSVIQQRGRLDVPLPPKLEAIALEFDCYICGLTLEKVEAQEDRWKYV